MMKIIIYQLVHPLLHICAWLDKKTIFLHNTYLISAKPFDIITDLENNMVECQSYYHTSKWLIDDYKSRFK